MGIARDHHDAVAELFKAHPDCTLLESSEEAPAATGLNVYACTPPPSAPAIYAQLVTYTPRGETERLNSANSVSSCRITLMYVANTEREVLWAVDIGHSVLERSRPISATRRCSPLKGGGGVVRNDNPQDSPGDWVATETWRFASTPKEGA